MTAGRTFVYFYLLSYSDVTVLCEEEEATAAMFFIFKSRSKMTQSSLRPAGWYYIRSLDKVHTFYFIFRFVQDLFRFLSYEKC